MSPVLCGCRYIFRPGAGIGNVSAPQLLKSLSCALSVCTQALDLAFLSHPVRGAWACGKPARSLFEDRAKSNP